jgi:hypothetical protein
MITSTLNIAGRDGGCVGLKADELADLDAQIVGPVLRAGDAGWDEAVRIWNAMVARTPALVVQPTSARDVAAAVELARTRGLLLRIKGGGHNIAGTAIADAGLMLDMSRMRPRGLGGGWVAADPAFLDRRELRQLPAGRGRHGADHRRLREELRAPPARQGRV